MTTLTVDRRIFETFAGKDGAILVLWTTIPPSNSPLRALASPCTTFLSVSSLLEWLLEGIFHVVAFEGGSGRRQNTRPFWPKQTN